ncbi:MAG: methionyl-tRNA synthetase, partial [Pseudonocardiales bacterium]|nr:methionyl-tRNA synthetase [Pseudonocardiales bacterium]
VHEALGGAGVWAAQPEIRQVDELGEGPSYPVLTGDYAAEQAHWTSTPIEVGRPLAKPTPIFTKLDPKLGETGPEWAPIAK